MESYWWTKSRTVKITTILDNVHSLHFIFLKLRTLCTAIWNLVDGQNHEPKKLSRSVKTSVVFIEFSQTLDTWHYFMEYGSQTEPRIVKMITLCEYFRSLYFNILKCTSSELLYFHHNSQSFTQSMTWATGRQIIPNTSYGCDLIILLFYVSFFLHHQQIHQIIPNTLNSSSISLFLRVKLYSDIPVYPRIPTPWTYYHYFWWSNEICHPLTSLNLFQSFTICNNYFPHLLYPNSLNLTYKDIYMTFHYLKSITHMYVS